MCHQFSAAPFHHRNSGEDERSPEICLFERQKFWRNFSRPPFWNIGKSPHLHSKMVTHTPRFHTSNILFKVFCSCIFYGKRLFWLFNKLWVYAYRGLQRVIKITPNITDTHLLGISDVHEAMCLHGAQRTLKDDTHPSQSLLTLLLQKYPLLYHISTEQLYFLRLRHSSTTLHHENIFIFFWVA